jgi:hypothetical protein
MTATTRSPESRLYAAGFARRLEFWFSPDGHRVLNLGDAIAALDSGEIQPGGPTVSLPDSGVRALPDELVECMFQQPDTVVPPWLDQLAELVAEKLKPVIRANLRKGRDS